ncbi:MAG: hypothetical protein JNK61_02505 [Bacteroidia bacterium]|nr:hypothetical protein [Bacteroidia bacterium]
MKPLYFFAAMALAAACNTPTAEEQSNVSDTPVVESSLPTAPLIQMQCFMQALNNDTTWVTLTAIGDTITGTMKWQPFAKDGAIGSLRGLKAINGEMHLEYDYIIEGQKQTETKIMKIENDSLFIKHGALVDADNNGHLKYKDEAAAQYTEILPKSICK